MKYELYQCKDNTDLGVIIGYYENGFLFLARPKLQMTMSDRDNIFGTLAEVEVVVGHELSYIKTFGPEFSNQLDQYILETYEY